MVEPKATTRVVRDTLAYYIRKAAAFRANLIPKDEPWNPKNTKYAARLEAVEDYIEALPEDNPMLQKLADCENLYDVDAGFSVPNDEWNSVIHCESTDPATWFESWAKDLIEWEPDPDEEDVNEWDLDNGGRTE